MRTLILALLLGCSPLAVANGQSSSSSPTTLAAINRLIQEQKIALTDAMAARNQAETERKAAITDATQARTEVAVQAERIKALSDNRDQWEQRSEWYRGEYDKLVKVETKYRAMSSRVNWVALGAGVLIGSLAAALFVFYSGGLAFSLPWVVLAVGGGTGTAAFAGIQLLFRLA